MIRGILPGRTVLGGNCGYSSYYFDGTEGGEMIVYGAVDPYARVGTCLLGKGLLTR
jgi:hypothetical protein